MAKFTHYLNLVQQRLFSKLFAVSAFLRKSLYSILFLILVFNDQVDRSEVSLSYLFYWFKQLMKTSKVDFGRQIIPPNYKVLSIFTLQSERLLKFLEADPIRCSQMFSF